MLAESLNLISHRPLKRPTKVEFLNMGKVITKIAKKLLSEAKPMDWRRVSLSET